MGIGVDECDKKNWRIFIIIIMYNKDICIYIYIYISLCVCVSSFVASYLSVLSAGSCMLCNGTVPWLPEGSSGLLEMSIPTRHHGPTR